MTERSKKPSGENRFEGSGLYLPVFLNVMDYHREMEAEDRTHAMTELVIVMKGSGNLICEDEWIPVERGDVFVIPPGRRHHYDKPAQMCMAGVLFDTLRLPMPKLDLPLLPGYFVLFDLKNRPQTKDVVVFKLNDVQYERIHRLVAIMRDECALQQPGTNFRAMGLFMALLGNLCAMYGSATGNGRNAKQTHERLAPLLEFMNREYLSPITFEDLLARASMSRSSLKRAFLRVVGVGPMHYLLKLRLEHATRLLSLTDKSVSEVAFASGFNDSNYFTRAFKKVYRISPSKYRMMPIPTFKCCL